MPSTHFTVHTTLSPSEVMTLFTDFGPDRASRWPNLDDAHFQVHELGPDWAEVTEGSTTGPVWQRSRYDWSTPGEVRIDVVDSNAFGPGSRWTYRVTPAAGGTDIDVSIVRVPNTTKGRVLDLLLSAGGGLFFGRDLRRTVHALERRVSPAP